MKKILTLLLIIISMAASAQSWTPVLGSQRFTGRLGIPVKDTVTGTAADSAQLVIRPQDGNLWYKYKGAWVLSSGNPDSVVHIQRTETISGLKTFSNTLTASVSDTRDALVVNTNSGKSFWVNNGIVFSRGMFSASAPFYYYSNYGYVFMPNNQWVSSNLRKVVSIEGTIFDSGVTGENLTLLQLSQTFGNNAGSATTKHRNIYIAPTNDPVAGVRLIGIENTKGTNYFNSVSGQTVIGDSSTQSGYKLHVIGKAKVTDSLVLDNLAGSGSRMVVANSIGQLSTSAIPDVTSKKDISDTLFNTGYTRRDRTKQGLDSLGVLKLNINDTSAMLSPYSRDYNTVHKTGNENIAGDKTLTGQLIVSNTTASTDYSKGIRFPNNPFGGAGDSSGLRLYKSGSTAEDQVLELYVGNDSSDRINFATGLNGTVNNNGVTINGNPIWNSGNLSPVSKNSNDTITGQKSFMPTLNNDYAVNIVNYGTTGAAGLFVKTNSGATGQAVRFDANGTNAYNLYSNGINEFKTQANFVGNVNFLNSTNTFNGVANFNNNLSIYNAPVYQDRGLMVSSGTRLNAHAITYKTIGNNAGQGGVGLSIDATDDASVTNSTKPFLYGMYISVNPLKSRTIVGGDDAVGLQIKNGTTVANTMATDAIYFGTNGLTTGSNPEWLALLSADANASTLFSAAGKYGNGLAFDNATFSTGTVLAMPNNTQITGKNFSGSSSYNLLKIESDNSLTLMQNGHIDASGAMALGGNINNAVSFGLAKNITGAANSYGIYNGGTIQSDVTSGQMFRSNPSIASGVSLNEVIHYGAFQGTYSSTPTNQYGLFASSGFTGGLNNYIVYSSMAAASGRWFLYNQGGAASYLSNTGFNTTSTSGAVATIKGTGTTSSTFSLLNQNSSNATTFSVNDAGTTYSNFGQINSSGTERLAVSETIGTGETPVIRSYLSDGKSLVLGGFGSSGATQYNYIKSTGSIPLSLGTTSTLNAIYIANDGGTGISTTTTTGARLTVKSSGTTSSTKSLLLQNSSNTTTLSTDDAGTTYTQKLQANSSGTERIAATETIANGEVPIIRAYASDAGSIYFGAFGASGSTSYYYTKVSGSKPFSLGTTSNLNTIYMLNDGKVGLGGNGGITSPLAWLHLQAGTTTIPSLIIPAASNTTTPLAGAVENNGSNLFYTNNSASRFTIPLLEGNNTFSGTNIFTNKLTASSIDTGRTTIAVVTGGALNKVRDSIMSVVTSIGSTYTPTLTNTTNITSSTLISATYERSGNIVTARIGLNVTPNLGGTDAVLTFTLPIASSLSSQALIGTGLQYLAGGVSNGGVIDATSTTAATFSWNACCGSVPTKVVIQFQYQL